MLAEHGTGEALIFFLYFLKDTRSFLLAALPNKPYLISLFPVLLS